MYSQGDEERYILAAFKDRKEPGRFIDIGSWHPLQFSNVRALYGIGWSGVCIEPSPGPMLNLIAEYGSEPRITLIQAAVGVESGLRAMHISNDALSTASDSEYERWKDKAEFIGQVVIPVITLEQITNQWGGFDFWSIDAEGLSGDILVRMINLDLRPDCVCVEYGDRLSELCAKVTQHGYRLTYANGTNGIFVR